MAKVTDGLNMPPVLTALRQVRGWIRPKWRNLTYYCKCRPGRAERRNVLVFLFEPGRKHPGIADRLKAIVSNYNLAKQNGYDFRLCFETPFRLADYLKPKYDWTFRQQDMEYSMADTRIVDEAYREVPKRLSPGKQYHSYNYEGHHMPRVFPVTGYRWCDLFHELFEPSDRLEKAYRALHIQAKTYVSVHLRFVNALEDFENTFFYNHLATQAERNALIVRCKEAIGKVMKQHPGLDVYVFSDSKVFLDSLQDMPVKVLAHDHIGHVSEGADADATLKSFLDLYVMSKGTMVYRACAPELYSISHYALLAATIGDIPMENLNV